MNEDVTKLKKWQYYFEEIELFGGTKHTRLVRKSKK